MYSTKDIESKHVDRWGYVKSKADYDLRLQSHRVSNPRIKKCYKQSRAMIAECSWVVKTMPDKQRTLSIEERFNHLAKEWKMETKGLSLAASKITNDHYLAIIGLGVTYGDRIVKLILNDLSNSTAYWHYALKKITNQNPVPKEFITDVDRTRHFWLEWATENRMI